MVKATLVKSTPYSDKFGSGIEFIFNSEEIGEYKTKKNQEYLTKEKNMFLVDLDLGSFVELAQNPQGAGYFINKSKEQPVKQIIEKKKSIEFEMKDPQGVFSEEKVDLNIKFDYAEKAFNKAFDIVRNKLEISGLIGKTLDDSLFKGEDIRTMINTVYMSLK